jgi:hypothetical protein
MRDDFDVFRDFSLSSRHETWYTVGYSRFCGAQFPLKGWRIMAATTPKDPNMMTSPMFTFVRAHWYVSIKTFVVYLILYFCTASLGLDWTTTACSVITFLVWVYFDYTDIYLKAMRDVNVVKYGYIQYDKLRGLKAGLLAQIPGLFLTIMLLVLSEANEYYSLFSAFYLVLYSPLMQLIGALKDSFVLIWVLPLLVVPITSQLGYFCGYNGLASGAMNRLIYRKKTR